MKVSGPSSRITDVSADAVTASIVEAARRHVVKALATIKLEEASMESPPLLAPIDELLGRFQALHRRLDALALRSASKLHRA
jgi:hypothetical protein